MIGGELSYRIYSAFVRTDREFQRILDSGDPAAGRIPPVPRFGSTVNALLVLHLDEEMEIWIAQSHT